jgi:hypothetical protein
LRATLSLVKRHLFTSKYSHIRIVSSSRSPPSLYTNPCKLQLQPGHSEGLDRLGVSQHSDKLTQGWQGLTWKIKCTRSEN